MNICSSSVHPGSNRTHLQARRPLRSDHLRSSPPPVVLVTVLHLTCRPILKTLRPCTPLFHILEPLQHRRNIFNLNRSNVRSGFRPFWIVTHPSKSAGPAFLIPVTASVRCPCCQRLKQTHACLRFLLHSQPPTSASKPGRPAPTTGPGTCTGGGGSASVAMTYAPKSPQGGAPFDTNWSCNCRSNGAFGCTVNVSVG